MDQIQIYKDKNFISTLTISELSGKRHDNVLRSVKRLIRSGSIRLIMRQNSTRSSAKPYCLRTTYTNNKSRKYLLYYLNPIAIAVLAATYEPILLVRILSSLLKVKKELNNVQLGIKLENAEARADTAQKQIVKDTKYTELGKAVFVSDTNITTREFIKRIKPMFDGTGIKMGPNIFLSWLRAQRYTYHHNNQNMPSQEYVNMGLFLAPDVEIGNKKVRWRVTVLHYTPKGQAYFVKKLKEYHNI